MSSAVCPLSNYISLISIDGTPILPPLMTGSKRVEANAWREKALDHERRLPTRPKEILETKEIPLETPKHEENTLEPTNEEESPVLSAYASRFGSGGHVKDYLCGLSVPKPPLSPEGTSPPSREEIRSSIAELDRQRDEAVQRFLEEQSRSLISLKKTFSEQRRKLLHQMNNDKKQQNIPLSSRTVISRLTPQQKKAFVRVSALVKGYLVRRLMATVRVQDILSSLKDSLQMALTLHQEAARNHRSTESDVNLHKTLLQQIHRDVRRFHEIFFENSTAEKMKMIALDREERKKEKPTKKFLSEATKMRIKRGKENRPTSAINNTPKGSPQVSKRSDYGKTGTASPRKPSLTKASPRLKKNIKVPSISH